MTEKNHTPASEQIIATTNMAQFSVGFPQDRRSCFSLDAFSLKLKLAVHRLPAAECEINSFKH